MTDISNVINHISMLPPDEQEKMFAMLEQYTNAAEREKCQNNFMPFVKKMWPGFISGRHHKLMADKFERVAKGELKRLIINMPPRHTKSEFASYLLPAWFLGRYPEKKVIQTSHTSELAVGFGRKVRNLVDSEVYKKVFPNVALRHDSKAAGRWATNEGGEYFAIGVGGAVTGKGADLLIIDDPHSEQEAKLAAADPSIFDSVYEWYTSGPRQRLQPGGAIIIVMCMTGDTLVLMADGSEKYLRDLRAGDLVATFEDGKLTTTVVNNCQSNGIDSIYKIQTKSGKILRANERHPFLVMNEGVLEWTRLKNLKPGDLLVSLKDVIDPQEQKQNPVNARLVKHENHITAKTLTHHTGRLVIMDDGRAFLVRKKVATEKRSQEVFAQNTMQTSLCQKRLQSLLARVESSLVMGLLLSNMKKWLRSAKTAAMSVAKNLLPQTHAHTGMASCALTIATKPEKCVDSCAMTAISQLDTEKRQAFLNALHHISDFTAEPIVSITPDGEEEVFDVEIDRTENFIANGFVSHNTRWSLKDLTGRVVQSSMEDEKIGEWEVIELPAILPSGNPLWPEFWSIEELEALKIELPISKWSAQYQQKPSAEEGAIIKREWWKIWQESRPPACEFLIQSWDTAYTKNERSDYSACTTWGVFYKDEDSKDAHIILLDAYKERLEFPELKQRAFEMWKEWEPDSFIVEAKAAGAPLIYELRQMGIPVQEYTPVRGNDKNVRLNAVSDLFASGKVWCPDKRWAHEVIEEMAAFPYGDHDDLTDSTTQALLRFRQGGFIRLDSDEPEQVKYFHRRKGYY